MARKEEIIADIVRCVALEASRDYPPWRIGVTNDVRERRAEWRYPKRFQYWPTESLRDAEAIASFFVRVKGMQSIGNDPDLDEERECYLYIF